MTARSEQIVDAAIELLADGGIAALTIKNLADAVGVTEPALYRHFKGKVDILVAILNRLRTDIEKLFEESWDHGENVLDHIQAVWSRILQHFATQPSMASVVFSEEMFRHDPRLSEHVSCIMDVVREHLLALVRSKKGRQACRQDVPAKDLVHVIMASLRFIVTRWRLSGHAFDLEKEGFVINSLGRSDSKRTDPSLSARAGGACSN